MAVTVIATVGGSTSNSYNSVADADLLIQNHVHTPTNWDAATTDQQGRYVIRATAMLEAQPWCQLPATSTQALMHPMLGLVDAGGRSIESTVIAPKILQVHAELSALLADSDRTAQGQRLPERIEAGTVVIDYGESGQARKPIPDYLMDLLAPYLDLQVGVVRT